MLSTPHDWLGAVCAAVALALTALAAVCAIAGLRRHPRSWSAVVAAVAMMLGAVDMVVPGVRMLHPLAWVALTLLATLALLVAPGQRGERAMHAGAMLVMAAMWATMAGPSDIVGGDVVAGGASGAAGHASHGSLPLAWAVLVIAVALVGLSARRALHHVDEDGVPSRGWSRWGHPLMAAGAACMALTMPLA